MRRRRRRRHRVRGRPPLWGSMWGRGSMVLVDGPKKRCVWMEEMPKYAVVENSFRCIVVQ